MRNTMNGINNPIVTNRGKEFSPQASNPLNLITIWKSKDRHNYVQAKFPNPLNQAGLVTGAAEEVLSGRTTGTSKFVDKLKFVIENSDGTVSISSYNEIIKNSRSDKLDNIIGVINDNKAYGFKDIKLISNEATVNSQASNIEELFTDLKGVVLEPLN